QMLATEIHDDVESKAGAVPGLALLPAVVRFGQAKVLRQCSGTALGEPGTGYEIHHGVVEPPGATPRSACQHSSPCPGGCAVGAVRGTTWHGLLESDGFRQALLSQVAAETGRRFAPGGVCFHDVRERQLDMLGDLVANHLDTAALMDLIEHGP